MDRDPPTHRIDRSFRLLKGEAVDDDMRRIACGQLIDAHERLSDATEQTLGTALHETRKAIKRVRASLRLTRDALGEPTYRRENTLLRGVAHHLAAGRDAQVRIDTLDALSERYGDELHPRAVAELRARLEQEHEQASAALQGAGLNGALSVLRGAQLRASRWTFERDGFDALEPGLRRTYRRGRRAMRAAIEAPTPENLHDWRKRVKDLWHAAEILEIARPKEMRRLARSAHKLSGLLGDGHDLSVLRDYVDAQPPSAEGPQPRQALLAVIDRRSAELCSQALKRGRKLYARSPKRFVRDVRRGWSRRAAGPPRA